MPPTLLIRLFGDFQLLYQDELLTTVSQARLQSLLAYLLLHDRTPQSRRHLAFRLWPDSTEAQARSNLRRELHHLRHALLQVDRFLVIDTQTVQRRADALYSLDITDLERALALAEEAERAGDDKPKRLARVLGMEDGEVEDAVIDRVRRFVSFILLHAKDLLGCFRLLVTSDSTKEVLCCPLTPANSGISHVGFTTT